MLFSEYVVRGENNEPLLTQDGEFILVEHELPEFRSFLINFLFRDNLYQSLGLVK